jgi:hypothetical protein
LSFGFDSKSVLSQLIKIVDIPFLPWFPWVSSAHPVSKVESVLAPARVGVLAAAGVALEFAAAVGWGDPASVPEEEQLSVGSSGWLVKIYLRGQIEEVANLVSKLSQHIHSFSSRGTIELLLPEGV